MYTNDAEFSAVDVLAEGVGWVAGFCSEGGRT